MKPKIYADTGGFFLIILLVLSIPVYISAQNFRSVQDGVEYAEMTREIDKLPVRMNLLRLDLTKVRLDVIHAMDAAIGTETTSSIAARHGAIAAINAGFFRLDTSIFAGDAAGVLKINGKVLSESFGNRIALFIDNQTGRTKVNFLHLNLGALVSIGKRNFAASGINRQRLESELIIFTPEFNRTTLTNQNGIEIVVQNGKIKNIFDGRGSTPIPSDGFVLSAAGKMREEILPTLKNGAKVVWGHDVKNTSTMNSAEPALYPFVQSEDITNGVPQLIKNGKIEITWEREKTNKAFVETRHPRTAVAKLKDGKFLMITVDGRSEESGGIGLQNLAEILLELGATDAMNLDGGGSTTMFLGGKVVNKPSDKEGERKVSDAILVFPRKK